MQNLVEQTSYDFKPTNYSTTRSHYLLGIWSPLNPHAPPSESAGRSCRRGSAAGPHQRRAQALHTYMRHEEVVIWGLAGQEELD